MDLVPNWRRVLKHAWSIRLILLAGFFSGLEIALPILDQWVAIPRGIFAGLSGFTSMAALVSRLVAQQSVSTSSKDNPNADQ